MYGLSKVVLVYNFLILTSTQDYANPFQITSTQNPQHNHLSSKGVSVLTTMAVFTIEEENKLVQKRVVLSSLREGKKEVLNDQYE